jgi:hypothetical protein
MAHDIPELRDYQIAHLAFFMHAERALDLSDPAVGKTPPACVWMYWLWTERQTKSAFVMPKSLLAKNRLEVLRFTGLDGDQVVIVEGTVKQRAKQMASTSGVIFLLGATCYANNWRELQRLQPQLSAVAVDEFHLCFAGATSQRTAEFWHSMDKHRSKHFKYFLAMTGSLIDGKLSSAYPAIHVIEPMYYASYDAFMLEHAYVDDYGRALSWYNVEKIKTILGRHAVRRTFTQAYGPEAKVIIPEICQMSAKQQAAYDEFEETALLELESSFLDGTVPAVAAIRCRQIMGAPEIHGIHKPGELTGKDERLKIHLGHCQETGKQMIIFASLQAEIERIHEMVKKMGMTVGMIHGGVSSSRRMAIDQQFQAGTLQIIVGSPATAAVGFNWGTADLMAFASLDYKDSNFIQGYRRAIRGTRATPLLIYVLQYETKVENRILEIVEEKSRLSQSVQEDKEVFSLRAPSVVVERISKSHPYIAPNKPIRMADFR